MSRFLSIQNLSKSYAQNGQTKPVFSELNFEIEKGEFITLLGQSGCGKSTLLRAIAGLTEIDGGQIWVENQNITDLAPQKRGIGMVFQHYALFPNLNVFDNVSYGLKRAKESPQEIKRKTDEILDLVDLTPYQTQYPDSLSGGQKQRVALARALVMRPKILLLDEPLSALDAPIRKHLRVQLRKIQQQLQLTTIFVTHDQDEAMELSDRIFLMEKGKFVQQSSPTQLYTRPASKSIAQFIGNYNLLDATQVKQIFNKEISQFLAIRPESILLNGRVNSEDATHLSLPFDVTIQSASLLGNIIRYQVELNKTLLTVDVLNHCADDHLMIGAKSTVRFNWQECIEVNE